MLTINNNDLLSHKELLLPNNREIKVTGTIDDLHILFLKQIYADVVDLSSAIDCTKDVDTKSFKGIKRIILPDNTTELCDFAFSFCPSLCSIYLSKSISNIGEQPFCYCNNLSSIEVDEQNEFFSSKDGVLFDKEKKKLIRCPEGQFSVYSVPEGVEEICEYAFYGCNGLIKIVLPQSLKRIGKCAFQQCEDLQVITIPDNVELINECTFFGCVKLKDITLPKNLKRIDSEAFYGCAMLEKIEFPKAVKHIDNPFNRCVNLSSISVEDGGDTFSSNDGVVYNKQEACLSLSPTQKSQHKVADGTKQIGRSAFELTTIENITIADSVTKICERAFRACYYLKEIVLPKNIKEIEDRAFDSCTNLTALTSLAVVPPKAHEFSFTFVPLDDAVLSVPSEAVDSYKSDPNWSKFKTILPLKQ